MFPQRVMGVSTTSRTRNLPDRTQNTVDKRWRATSHKHRSGSKASYTFRADLRDYSSANWLASYGYVLIASLRMGVSESPRTILPGSTRRLRISLFLSAGPLSARCGCFSTSPADDEPAARRSVDVGLQSAARTLHRRISL